MAVSPNRSEPKDIAAGFSIRRSVYIPPIPLHALDEYGLPDIREMFVELADVAIAHTGTELHVPPEFRSTLPGHHRTDVKIVKSSDIRRNYGALGYLYRQTVDAALLKTTPSLRQDIYPVRIRDRGSIRIHDDSGQRILSLAMNHPQLGRERQSIRTTLASLACVGAEDLDWTNHCPDLVVAYFDSESPPDLPGAMREVVAKYVPFDIGLRGVPGRTRSQ